MAWGVCCGGTGGVRGCWEWNEGDKRIRGLIFPAGQATEPNFTLLAAIRFGSRPPLNGPGFPFSIFFLAHYSSAVQRWTLSGTVCGVEALKHLMQLSDINTNTGGGHKVCIIDFSGSFICSGGGGGLGRRESYTCRQEKGPSSVFSSSCYSLIIYENPSWNKRMLKFAKFIKFGLFFRSCSFSLALSLPQRGKK